MFRVHLATFALLCAACGSAPTPGAEAPLSEGEIAPHPYNLTLEASESYAVGEEASVSVVLVAKDDYKCNDKYPYKFKLDEPPEGVSYAEMTVKGIEYGKKRSSLTVPFETSSAGSKTISGSFFFSVCNATTCKIEREKISTTVLVK
ncbi:hypothetical protein JYT22_00715 [Endomicrobium sp. AH-315-J14]|nr:hypothetical protein [Endomicrobium sp. AH-315-J14]